MLVIDVIAPFIAELFKCSLTIGQFRRVFKEAFITPVIKKPGLDVADPGSYRPISNCAVMSKLLERLVAAQLVRYLVPVTCFHLFNLDFGRVTRQRLLYYTCCRTFWRPLIVEMLLHSGFYRSFRHGRP